MPLVRRRRWGGRHEGRLAVLLCRFACYSVLACCGRNGLGAETVDFGRQVQPILSGHCFACHGPDEKSRQSDLRLDVRAAATADRDGVPAIRAGDPKSSEMVRRITASDPDERMPPATAARSLSAAEIEVLVRWVQEGAPYATHWSYRKPVRPPIPSTGDSAWAREAVDRFVLARLEREGLQPSPEADRPTLARRAALAITGLPLGVEQCDAFLNDRSPEAYERLVDRLLAERLLESTLVILGGEFGRTPFREGRTAAGKLLGRDHYPDCHTMVLAGGGIKPGVSYGETDELSFSVARDPVDVHDLQATLLCLLGFDHQRLTYRFQGRDFRLTDVHGKLVQGILA